jgi:hypothetical protein
MTLKFILVGLVAAAVPIVLITMTFVARRRRREKALEDAYKRRKAEETSTGLREFFTGEPTSASRVVQRTAPDQSPHTVHRTTQLDEPTSFLPSFVITHDEPFTPSPSSFTGGSGGETGGGGAGDSYDSSSSSDSSSSPDFSDVSGGSSTSGDP